MKNINLRTTLFWSAMVSAVALLVQSVLNLAHISYSSENINDLVKSINVLISALSIGGILINPEKVFSKEKPADDENDEVAG